MFHTVKTEENSKSTSYNRTRNDGVVETHKKAPHTSLDDLFFDLIYVAVAFLLGDVLITSTKVYEDDYGYENSYDKYNETNETTTLRLLGENSRSYRKVYHVDTSAIGLFISLFLCFYGEWFSRLCIRSWLKLEDMFHKGTQAIQSLLIALAAHSIVKENILENFNNNLALVISVCIFLNQSLDLALWIEMALLSSSDSGRYHAKKILPGVVGRCSMLLLAIVGITVDWPFSLIKLFWASSLVIPRILLFLQQYSIWFKWEPKKSIPMYVEYVIHRIGEWTLLMLGEGVLQIVQSNEKISASFIVEASLSFLIMAMLHLLHYSTFPFHPNDHVVRTSAKKAVIWINIEVLYSMALVLVGIALKLGFKPDREGFTGFLGGTLSISVALLFIAQSLHKITDEFVRNSKKTVAIRRFYKAILVLSFLISFAFEGIDSDHHFAVIFFNLCMLFIVIVFQFLLKAFKKERRLRTTIAVMKAAGKFKMKLVKRGLRTDDTKIEKDEHGSGVDDMNHVGPTQKPNKPLVQSSKAADRKADDNENDINLEPNLNLNLNSNPENGDNSMSMHKKLKEVIQKNGNDPTKPEVLNASFVQTLGVVDKSILSVECEGGKRINPSKEKEDSSLIFESNNQLQCEISGSNSSSQPNTGTDNQQQQDLYATSESMSNFGSSKIAKPKSDFNKKNKPKLCHVTLSDHEKILRMRKTEERKWYQTETSSKIWAKLRDLDFYKKPENLLEWEALENTDETDWAELFFDLIYVALLVEIGIILVHSVSSESKHIEVWYYFSLFIIIAACWQTRAYFVNTFAATSLFHKILDMIEGCLITVMAAVVSPNIGLNDGYEPLDNDHAAVEEPDFSNFTETSQRIRLLAGPADGELIDERSFALTFASCLFMLNMCSFFRVIEILWTTKKPRMRGTAQYLKYRCVLQSVPVACSFIPASMLTDNDERSLLMGIVTLLWFLAWFLPNMYTLFMVLKGNINAENTVPVDIGNLIHRHGEWMILALGTGVILAIIPVEDRNADYAENCIVNVYHISLFSMTFLVLVAMRRLYTYVERFHKKSHALRRSRLRGFTWKLITPFLSCATVAVGASLNKILVLETYAHVSGCPAHIREYVGNSTSARILADTSSTQIEELTPADGYYISLAVSCSFFTVVLWCLDLLHVGPCEFTPLTTGDNIGSLLERLFIYILKLVAVFLFYIIPALHGLNSQVKLLLIFSIFVADIPLHHWHSNSRRKQLECQLSDHHQGEKPLSTETSSELPYSTSSNSEDADEDEDNVDDSNLVVV